MIVKTAELARLIGVSDRRVNQLAKEGVFDREAPGKFDAPRCVQAYIAHMSGRQQVNQVQLDLDQERARLAREQADGHELKNRERRGELVDAETVVREWHDILRTVRSALLAVPSRVRQQLAHLEPDEIAVVDREIRDALEALSHGHSDHAPAGANGAAATAAPAAIGVD